MALVKEGTTMSGFTCDHPNCSKKAISTPVVNVPWEGDAALGAALARRPITVMKDLQYCRGHQACMPLDELLSPAMRLHINGLAEANRGKPDFARAEIYHLRVVSWAYQKFLEDRGIVKPGDSTPKEEGRDIIIPNLQ